MDLNLLEQALKSTVGEKGAPSALQALASLSQIDGGIPEDFMKAVESLVGRGDDALAETILKKISAGWA